MERPSLWGWDAAMCGGQDGATSGEVNAAEGEVDVAEGEGTNWVCAQRWGHGAFINLCATAGPVSTPAEFSTFFSQTGKIEKAKLSFKVKASVR